jgi:hypothetical protein
MEVRPRDEQNTLTPESAAQTVDYWRNATSQLLNDADAQASDAVRKSYSKLLSSQGGLFEQRKHMAEAEQLFRLASEMCPYSPRPSSGTSIYSCRKAGSAKPCRSSKMRCGRIRTISNSPPSEANSAE